jgi:beta-glucosidase
MRAIFLTLAGCPLGFTSTMDLDSAAAQSAKPLPYLDSSLPKEQRAADLVSRMTLDEKVSEMLDSSEAIPRLNVPALDW